MDKEYSNTSSSISKIDYADYILEPIATVGNLDKTSKARSGTLLQISWGNHLTGYADLFPWPELGDLSLDQLKQEIKKKNWQQFLIKNSISIAILDAQARAEKKSLFDDQYPVKNYYLCPDLQKINHAELELIKQRGFKDLKIKMQINASDDILKLNQLFSDQDFSIRLDLNNFASLEKLAYLNKNISPRVKEKIVYVEDPFRFDLNLWKDANKLFSLGFDLQGDLNPFDYTAEDKDEKAFEYIIYKPARKKTNQENKSFSEALEKDRVKIVVTSSLDHPLGQAYALYEAQRIGKIKKDKTNMTLPAGALSLWTYNVTGFESEFVYKGNQFYKTKGFGLGFDEQLQKQNWKNLI